MLKVEMNKGQNSIEVCGSVVEICADVGLLIKVIYEVLENKKCKEFFADSMKDYMNEGIYAKTDVELEEINAKKAKENKEDLKEDLFEGLKDLLNDLKKALDSKDDKKDLKK
jgi:hypothetical protein